MESDRQWSTLHSKQLTSASDRPVGCARLCEAGEGEEELAVFSAAAKACDGANSREGNIVLLAACGQAVDL